MGSDRDFSIIIFGTHSRRSTSAQKKKKKNSKKTIYFRALILKIDFRFVRAFLLLNDWG